ncbi:MAG TPA: LysM domain-containing protein, partial [Anaerolineaceae bacterium]|nr:LysM domain-containing protein [Anaerolineaceae bacterium]
MNNIPTRKRVATAYIISILVIAFIGLIYLSSYEQDHNNNSMLNIPLRTKTVRNDPGNKRDTNTPTTLIQTIDNHFLPTSTQLKTPESVFITATPTFNETIYHQVKPFDTINSIGMLYGMTSDELRRMNWMHGNAIIPGQNLIIRPGLDWLPENMEYSLLNAPSMGDLLIAYPLSSYQHDFNLHYMPQTYPAVDPEAIGYLFSNAKQYLETKFNLPLHRTPEIFLAGNFFEIPNQYIRGHSFGKDGYIMILHDGSGDWIDQQYLAAHEATHYYMWNTFGQPNSFLLSEGTAVWIGKEVTSNMGNIELESFCKSYSLKDKLPQVSNKDLSYKGQNYDLENYYAAGCFVKYLVDHYGIESLQNIYSNAEYERVYGKSLTE